MTMTVKAYAAYEVNGRLEPFEYELDSLKPDEVEIDVEFCGICRSDLRMLKNDWRVSMYPLVPGHEVVGRVAEVGSMVNHLYWRICRTRVESTLLLSLRPMSHWLS